MLMRLRRTLSTVVLSASIAGFIPILSGCGPVNVCNSMTFSTNVHDAIDHVGMVHVATNQNICVAPDGTVTSNTGATNVATYGAYAPVTSAQPLSDTGYTGPTTDIQGWDQWISVNVTLQVTIELKAFGIVFSKQNERCTIHYVAQVTSGGDKVDSYAVPLNALTKGSCSGGFSISNAT